MINQAQLITYPDSLGGNLSTLYDILETHFSGLFGGVHILPPYPSSGDRGFAPTTYFEIDPRFGSWADIRRLASRYEVLLDVMVNHISRRSVYFQDFAQQGRKSPYADLFLTLDKVWPGGKPDPDDVAQIFLRRPVPPFADVQVADTGKTEQVWATFGTKDWSEQIDLDVNAPATRKLLRKILGHLSQQGIRAVRLDAIAFVNKQPGTSCFFVEPQIYSFIDWIQAEAHAVGMEALPEIHADPPIHHKLAEHGYWSYDFALPFLVLQALFSGDGRVLQAHLQRSPQQQVTMLDCHDGIPVQPDVNGLVSVEAAQQVVQTCLARGANLNRILSPEHRLREDFDAHQINITYYSALGRQDEAYLAARAIQLFAPGIPQVYYMGLLAGENDQQAVMESGEGRAINRHNYTVEEVQANLQRPVVQRQVELIRLRNRHPAFGGEFEVKATDEGHLEMTWRKAEDYARLRVDLKNRTFKIETS